MLEDNTKKIIADQWISLLYTRLEQLNEAYIRMHEGCIDLTEFVPMLDQRENMERIQYQNAGFIITYMRNILSNARSLFDNDKWDKLKDQIEILDKIHTVGAKIDGTLCKVFELKRSDVTKKQTFKLTSYFNVLIKGLDDMYEEIITEIKDILFLEGNIKSKPRA